MTINYLQWLITVVNDCVFYFIKKQEPVYAFHTLVLAEFYIKKILHKSGTDTGLFDLADTKPRKKKFNKNKELEDSRKNSTIDKFIAYTTKMCDPT